MGSHGYYYRDLCTFGGIEGGSGKLTYPIPGALRAVDFCRKRETSHRKRCTKCILPENFPGIRFNEKGICNYCVSHTPIQYKGESALRSLLDRYRGKGKKYDCVVPVSGGKDSSFVLYSAVEEYKMRALALNYLSGFTSDQAKQNISNAMEMLHIDYIQIKSKRDIQRKCLKDNLEAWVMRPSSEAFPTLCYGCKDGYLNGAYRIAGQMGIPLVLLGDSQMENSVLHESSLHRFHEFYLAHLAKKFGRNPHYLHPRRVYHYLLVQAEFALPARVHRFVMRSPPRIVHWFDFVRYDDRRILSTVMKKMGWERPLSSVSSWRFDCKIHAIKDEMYRRKLGYSETDELLSKMIRERSLTRGSALEIIEQENRNEGVNVAIASELLEEMGLSEMKGRLLLWGNLR